MRVVAAPDKFKGTATAHEIADAILSAVTTLGGEGVAVPMADGGEGTLAALGGANRTSMVTGPLGDPVEAAWRFANGTAVIEMAEAAGLVLAGGADANDPVNATTAGVGELIGEAVDAGAERVIIGVGGSATTDGGLGALEALGSVERVRGTEMIVACDVRTAFTDAGKVFGPQKGASRAQVMWLTTRLEQLAERYHEQLGVDVRSLPRAGAAGGLAGGLAAAGARLVDGFDVIADTVGLARAIEGADLVITGEGFIDAESFDGKVVGGVAELAAENDVALLAVAGQVFDGAEERVRAISLADRFGVDTAMASTVACVTEVILDELRGWTPGEPA